MVSLAAPLELASNIVPASSVPIYTLLFYDLFLPPSIEVLSHDTFCK